MYSVREVLESRNVAVIGASQDPGKPGALLLKALKDTGFRGQVAGVNPRGGEEPSPGPTLTAPLWK